MALVDGFSMDWIVFDNRTRGIAIVSVFSYDKLPPFQESLKRTISLIQDVNVSAHLYPSLYFLEVVVQ
jgi:hypothetical protein